MGNYEHDPYASGGSDYAKDPYAGGGSAYVHDPYRGSSPAPKKSGGGIFGHAAHWVASKAGLAAHDLKTIPGGIEQMAKVEAREIATPHVIPGLPARRRKRYSTNTSIPSARRRRTLPITKP